MAKKPYQQLTYEERCQIHALKKRGLSHRTIAQQLNRDRRTIDREVHRNTGHRGYRYKQAQEKAERRKHQAKPHLVRFSLSLRNIIRDKLTQYQWSPEQISGWLKRQKQETISPERIYQFIWHNKRLGGKLYLHLRRKAKRYLKRVNGKTARGQIKGRVPIENRPKLAEARARIGDWEADTIVGKGHQGAIVSLVDRKTRYSKLIQVSQASAKMVAKAIVQALSGYPVNTITFDNGKEFAKHQVIARLLKTKTFFAKPYHSWQRGTNENTNGLVRQYFPKKTCFVTLTQYDVAVVEQKLNNRPRKCLNYMTPTEAIHSVA